MSNRWRMYNPNPAGRAVGDCAVRAVSAALGISWENAYARIANAGYQMGDMPSSNSVWGSVLRQAGFVRENLPNTCPDCYTVRDFCLDHSQGVYVLGTGSHAVTVIDGDYMDAWDSGNEVPLYYYERG